MGGNRDEPRYDQFHAVLSLDWGGSADITDKNIECKDWYFQDGPLIPDAFELEAAVMWVWRRWFSGTPVLVRCQAGLNRSGLVVARVLIDNGMKPQDAIDVIREMRSPNALFNPAFTKYLLALS